MAEFFLNLGILFILAGFALCANGIWIVFASKKIKHKMDALDQAHPNNLSNSDKKESLYYKLEKWMFKSSPFLIVLGLFFIVIHWLIK